jgi:hypothetical protein
MEKSNSKNLDPVGQNEKIDRSGTRVKVRMILMIIGLILAFLLFFGPAWISLLNPDN